MKDIKGKIDENRLDKVNGGAGATDTLLDKAKDLVGSGSGRRQDSVPLENSLLAGEAVKTERNPLESEKASGTFGSNLGAGSGMV